MMRATTAAVLVLGGLALFAQQTRASSAVGDPSWVGVQGVADLGHVPTELPLIGPEGRIVVGPDGQDIMIPIVQAPEIDPVAPDNARVNEALKDVFEDVEPLVEAGPLAEEVWRHLPVGPKPG